MNDQTKAAMQMACVIAALILISGCSDKPAMTNQEIVEQTKFCQSNGLFAMVYTRHALSPDIVNIRCEPRNHK